MLDQAGKPGRPAGQGRAGRYLLPLDAKGIPELNVWKSRLHTTVWTLLKAGAGQRAIQQVTLSIAAIAPKIGCVLQIPLEWVKRAGVETVARLGVGGAEAKRVKDLEREDKQMRRAA